MEHLGAIETKIASRIARNDFTCMSSLYFIDCEITPPAKKSNTGTFWRRNYFAVSLVKEAAGGGEQKMESNLAFSKLRTWLRRFSARRPFAVGAK
jgi:hypothetical protein